MPKRSISSHIASVEAIFTDIALSDGNSPMTPSQPKGKPAPFLKVCRALHTLGPGFPLNCTSYPSPQAPSSHTDLLVCSMNMLGTLPPQDLWAGCSFCLEFFPPIYLHNLLTPYLLLAFVPMSPLHSLLWHLIWNCHLLFLHLLTLLILFFPTVLFSITPTATWHSMHLCGFCLSCSIKIYVLKGQRFCFIHCYLSNT